MEGLVGLAGMRRERLLQCADPLENSAVATDRVLLLANRCIPLQGEDSVVKLHQPNAQSTQRARGVDHRTSFLTFW